MRRFLIGFLGGLNNLLKRPQQVVWLCLGVLSLNLVLDGSLFRLWSLHRDAHAITDNLQALQAQNYELNKRLRVAKDPAFLEREARERFDLVSKGDLVFVFSEEDPE